MASFTQSVFPVSQNPLLDSGVWEPAGGSTGVCTDANGEVKSGTVGWQVSRLSAAAVAFTSVIYVEVEIGNEAGNIGVAAWSSQASGWGGVGAIMTGADTLLIREYGDASDVNIYSTLNTISPALAPGGTIGIGITPNATPNVSNYDVYVDGSVVQSGTVSHTDGLALQPAFIGQNITAGTLASITAHDSFVAALPVDVAPASVRRGEANVEITGAGFGATRGTGTVTYGGVAVTVTAWSDVSIIVTIPADIDLKHSATGYAFTVTNSSLDTGSSDSVPFNPEVGYSFIDQVNPVADPLTVWSEIAAAPVTGTQAVYQSVTTPSGISVTVDAQGYVAYGIAPTVSESFGAYSIGADGTYNDDQTVITYTVEGLPTPPSTLRRGKLTVLQNSGGQIAVDGTASGTSVPLYLSLWNELGLTPNGRPVDTVVLSGGNFYNRLGEQLMPGPVYVGPSRQLTNTPNGVAVGTIA